VRPQQPQAYTSRYPDEILDEDAVASEAVGSGSIPGGTTTGEMQGKSYKIRDFYRFLSSPGSCPSHTQRHEMALKHFKICYLMLPKRKRFALNSRQLVRV
jgi:hypothetical protein